MRSRGARLAEAPNVLSLIFVAVLAVVVVHNAFTYPSAAGFDAEGYIQYARMVIDEWRIPAAGELRNYYTPPGFFLLAGVAIKLGSAVGPQDPAHFGQLLNGVLTIGTAILLAVLCSIVFPGRRWLRCAALGFFVALPIVLKVGAMFHPQPLVVFLATLALVLAARMLSRSRYGHGAAVALGSVVGAGQLVRSSGTWAFGVVCLVLLVAAITRPPERRAALRALVVVAVVGVLVALPWYAYLQTDYSNPIFGRSSSPASTSSPATIVPGRFAARAPFRLAAATPVLPSQRFWFYVDPGLPELVRAPHRQPLVPAFWPRQPLVPAFWPLLYSDAWGDYFGSWKWGSVQRPLTPEVEDRLSLQAMVGFLPTFLASAGLLALCLLGVARVRSQPELLLVPLMPIVALAGTLYYSWSYPSVDGDTVKALFLLPAAPAFAICFGFAVDVLWRRSRWVGVAVLVPLVASFVVSVAFGIA